MVNLSGKSFAAIIIVVIIIVSVCFAIVANVGGLGDKVKGAGGPFAAGAIKLAQAPMNWAINGGGPTLAIFYLLMLLAVPCAVAWAVWHYDLPYKITGQGQNAPGNYQSTPSQNIIPLDNGLQSQPTQKQ